MQPEQDNRLSPVTVKPLITTDTTHYRVDLSLTSASLLAEDNHYSSDFFCVVEAEVKTRGLFAWITVIAAD